MRRDSQNDAREDDAPEALREETAILDAMDDGGEVLAVACHDQLSLPSASPRGNFPSRSLTTPRRSPVPLPVPAPASDSESATNSACASEYICSL